MILSPLLENVPGIRHGFFTREGGFSGGIYAGRNTGLGSKDDRATVLRNRAAVAADLGLPGARVLSPYQYHSADVVTVTEAWPEGTTPPDADALVTAAPGLVIGVNTADCTPVLFASGDGRTVGAAHAGWKGAIGGVLEATVARMRDLGARDIRAAIGPTISQASYEVGPEFRARLVDTDPANARFFAPSTRENHSMFDLPGYVASRLARLDLAGVEDLALCTYADEARFFSYRRTTHRAEPDYGRQFAAIAIAP